MDTDMREETEDNPHCYICWDEAETDSNPIRRDCECKGTSGWVHIHCLVESVECKGHIDLLDPILRPWSNCKQCLEPYRDPTKRELTKALIADRPRLTKRIIASMYHATKWLAGCCLYFLYRSILRVVVDFSMTMAEEPLEALWKDASWELRTALAGICACILYKIIRRYHYEFQTFFIWIVYYTAGVVALLLPFAVEKLCNSGFAVALVYWQAFVFYAIHAAPGIWRRAVQIRRRDFVTTISKLATIALFLFLYDRIQLFVETLYIQCDCIAYAHMAGRQITKFAQDFHPIDLALEWGSKQKNPTRGLYFVVGVDRPQLGAPGQRVPIIEFWKCCI